MPPPEPVPWDRKDFFRQRKHERSEPPPFGRLRDSSWPTSSSSHYGPREFSRWGSGDFRRPPGHGKLGGWHLFTEETGHGYAPSRSSARIFDDERYQQTASRGDWRYNRNSRDSRVSFNQRDWKSHTWETNNGSPGTLGRSRDMNNERRSVDDRPSNPSGSHSTLMNSLDQLYSKDQQDNKVYAPEKTHDVNNDLSSIGDRLSLPSYSHCDLDNSCDEPQSKDQHAHKVCSPMKSLVVNNDQSTVDDGSCYPSDFHSDLVGTWDQICSKDLQDRVSCVNGLNNGKQSEKENSLGSTDWKHLRWTRSGSLSSRGSGFSHSSSSKSLGAVDSTEVRAELLPKNVTPIQSPSGDGAVFRTSSAPSEEMASRKKPRLGWGEGLAKYEKKKVESPETNATKDCNTMSTNSVEEVGVNLVVTSPVVAGFSDSASPATPSSFAYATSPGMEDKLLGKAANNDTSNPCDSASLLSHPQLFPFNLEKMDSISIANLGYSLIELLHSDDPGSVDSGFVRATAVNKVLVWKADILKTLEMTESEIDSLENELKVLRSESGSFCPHLAATSSSSPDMNNSNLSEEREPVSTLIPQPAPMQIDSCVAEMVEKMPVCNAALNDVRVDAKDEGANSPGTATSQLSESLSLFKGNPLSNFVGHDGSGSDMAGFQTVESIRSLNEVHVSACGDGSPAVKGEIVELASSNYGLDKDGEDMLHAVIVASNKESASKASEVFNKLLPQRLGHVDMSEIPNMDYFLIKEKVAARRQFLRFKEKVLTLKFKAFTKLWKEDRRLLSTRKYHAKSQKTFHSSLRSKHVGTQKHRSSIRLKFSSPEGDVSLVRKMELVNCTSKVLSDFQWKLYRDTLRMPALILDENEKVISKFISNNGLVEDPCAVEKERTIINPWTQEEKEIFMDKLATCGKNFRKIASFLDHKTTADCVEFYYKNHKSDCFEKAKKKLDYGMQGKSYAKTYMVAPGKKWTREMNAASLDILGAVSAIAARANKVAANRRISSNKISLRGCSSSRSSQLDNDSFIRRSRSFDLPEKETVAVDVLAGICGSVSSEAISSCITSSVDPRDGYREWQFQKLDAAPKEAMMSSIMQNGDNGDDNDDDTCSDESCGQTGPTHWTDEERSAFVRAFSYYGKDFTMISRCVRTRSRDQCKVFFSKVRKCLALDLMHPQSTSVSDDANGGGSDIEDASLLETSSAICNDESETKMDETMPASPFDMNHHGSDSSGPVKLKTDLDISEQGKGIGLPHLEQASEIMSSDEYHSGNKLKIVFENGSNVMNVNTVENQSQLPRQAENDLEVLTDKRELATGRGFSASVVVSVGPSSSLDVTIQADAVMGGQNPLSSETISKAERDASDAYYDEQVSLLQNMNIARNSIDQADDTTSSSFSYSGCLHQVPIEVSMDDPWAITLPRKKSAAFANPKSSDSPLFQAQRKHNQDRLSSKLDLEDGKQSHKLMGRILRGSSLEIPTRKEMNGYGSKKLSEVPSTLKSDVCITASCLSQDFSLRKCNGSTSNGSMAKHPGLSHRDLKSIHPRAHSRSLSDSEKPRRNSNVKLFGTILTSHGSENEEAGHPKQSGKPSTQVTALHNANSNLTITRFNDSDQLGLQNVPITSYGFWDGNRIRTGFSSLPDSAILLAKYPAIFGNYPASTSGFEQQALQSVAKNNGNYPNGLSVYSRRDMNGSSGVAGYRMFTDHNGARVQPFSVDIKQGQDISREMHRRNGSDTSSTLHDISDPVVAVRMHYEKTNHFSTHNGSVISEEHRRGSGDDTNR